MSRSLLPPFALSALLLFACGDDVPSGPSGPDSPDAGNPGTDGGGGGNDGVLPPLVPQSGVAYVAHFLGSELRSYRTDTAVPVAGPTLDLGTETHDLILDDVGDRLVAIHDVTRKAQLFSLERPATPGAGISAPSFLAEISFVDIPRFATINPYRNRLFVVTADPMQLPLVTMSLHAYDITDATNPVAVDGWPKTIPVTVSFALDPVRDVLFLVELTTDTLFAYDIGLDQFDELGGAPIVLTDQFPQENQASFQARNLVADFRRNRLLAAREQTALSELIVIDYPADIPSDGARYRDFADLTGLSFVDDGFDVDVPLGQRSNLLGAYVPAVDQDSGVVFMSSNAWNGSASQAVLTAFAADASLQPGCNDVPGEGFGCFLRGFVGGSPVSFKRTDGAMCVDGSNKKVITTSIVAGNEEQPGQIHIFDYAGGLGAMSAVLPDDGGNLGAGPLPIGAVCH